MSNENICHLKNRWFHEQKHHQAANKARRLIFMIRHSFHSFSASACSTNLVVDVFHPRNRDCSGDEYGHSRFLDFWCPHLPLFITHWFGPIMNVCAKKTWRPSLKATCLYHRLDHRLYYLHPWCIVSDNRNYFRYNIYNYI